jgi:hypothetical protein
VDKYDGKICLNLMSGQVRHQITTLPVPPTNKLIDLYFFVRIIEKIKD